jgi:hypothetical protein
VKIYTLAELRSASLPPLEPIIEGLLHAGETILLVGRPKVGKSRLTNQIALDLSRGTNFLGHFRIARGYRVAVLDLENRAGALQARFAHLSSPSDCDEQVFVCPAEILADSSELGVTHLAALVNHAHADVLIIDTWRLYAGADENDAGSVVAALKALSEIRKTWPQVAIILVHHLRKERSYSRIKLREDPFSWVEGVSGHHALVGHVDACFGLERENDSDGDELIVFGGVARNSLTTTVLLEEDEQTLLFKVRCGLDAAIAVMTPKELDFWNVASALKRFTFTELVKKTGTTNKKMVSSMLRKAQAHKIIQPARKGYVALA